MSLNDSNRSAFAILKYYFCNVVLNWISIRNKIFSPDFGGAKISIFFFLRIAKCLMLYINLKTFIIKTLRWFNNWRGRINKNIYITLYFLVLTSVLRTSITFSLSSNIPSAKWWTGYCNFHCDILYLKRWYLTAIQK